MFSPPTRVLSHSVRTLVRMDLTGADEIMGDLRRINLASAAAPSVIGALTGVQRLRGILDATEIELARRLNDLTHNAPTDLAAATQRPRRSADRVYTRAATLAAIPSLNKPLQSGRLQGAHVDTVAKILSTIDEKHAAQFTATLPDLIDAAASTNTTPDELARTLNRVARALENDDGISRFQQQRRDTALHTWTDKRTGMFRLTARFDPMSGLLLHNHIQAMNAALFAERVPSTCPTDPSAKQDHLRALALLALVLQPPHAGLTLVPTVTRTPDTDSFTDHSDTDTDNAGPTTDGVSDHTSPTDDTNDATTDGNVSTDNETSDAFDEWSSFFRRGPSRLGRPEIVVVLDARQQTLDANNGQPITEWGLPIELPPRALEELFQRADAHPIIIADGVCCTPPAK